MVPTFQVQTRNLIDNPQLSGAIALITEDAIDYDYDRQDHILKEPTILMDREILSPCCPGRIRVYATLLDHTLYCWHCSGEL